MRSLIDEAQAKTNWMLRCRDDALTLFRAHLAALATDKPVVASLGADDMLWVEESFFSRAAQEGLDHSLKNESALKHIETFLHGRKLDEGLEYLEWIQDRHVPEIKRLAETSALLPEAPVRATILQAELEICRHLALSTGRLRSIISQGRRQTYPSEPLTFADAMPCPLSDLSRNQSAIRKEWTGDFGVGDCWGRAHGGTLNDFARYSQSVGGRIDRSLKSESSEGDTRALQSRRLRMAMMTASELAEELILASPTMCRRVAGGAGSGEAEPWSGKSRQQFRSAARLFTKFMGAVPFVQATHRDFVDFYKVLLTLPADHHTRLADEKRSLREIAARLSAPEEKTSVKSLKPRTARRHLGNLRMLQAWLRTAFILPLVYWEDIISWRGENRFTTYVLTNEKVQGIFQLPIWTGAAHYRGTPREGEEVWHNASYWVPLLQWYSGIARDALCATELVDVTSVGDLHCLQVRVGVGGVTNDRGFARSVPLHSELLRLGFLDYVRALRAEGETMLFPELRRASGQLAADVFSSRYWRPIRAALPDLEDDCGVGAIRIAAERALKDLKVPEDMRRDLFGVRGKSQIDICYSKMTPPVHLARVVAKIPNLTSHIESRPIRLIPAEARAPTIARVVPQVQVRLDRERALSGVVNHNATISDRKRL